MIYNGNCLEIMKEIPSETYTSIITDPPYALEFLGKDWDKTIPDSRYWKEALRIVKPGGFIFAFGGSRTFHRLCVAIEDAGWEIRDMMMWVYGSGMPKSHNISAKIDEHLGAERSKITIPANMVRNQKAVGGGKGDEQGSRPFIRKAQERGYHEKDSDTPVTQQAKDFYGYGTGLRPSHEPIIIAMKPVDKTYHNNALTHGIAGLNIEATRIGNDTISVNHNKGDSFSQSYKATGNNPTFSHTTQHKGRWPSNVVFDPVAAKQLDKQSGLSKSSGHTRESGKSALFGSAKRTVKTSGHAGFGGASRFFYVAKPTSKEKGKFNDHPTVKPLQLMRYLIMMVSQPNKATKILDPFCGSGSTLVAAEQVGVECDGIEQNKHYIDIIESRLENIRNLKLEKKKSGFKKRKSGIKKRKKK